MGGGGGVKTETTQDYWGYQEIFLPKHPMCFLCVCNESCFYTFGRIDWVGWRLTLGEDGWGWSTRGPQEITHMSCKTAIDSSPFDHHSNIMKDHFMGTARNV